MTLIKTSLLSAISTIIKILSNFIIIKVIAIYIGPNGLALIGQFQNFISITTSIATGGIKGGIIKFTAEYLENKEEIKKLWSTSFKITSYITVIISLILLFGSKYFSLIIFKTDKYYFVFIILGITLIMFVWNSLILSILNGRKEIKKLIIINIISNIIGLILIIVATYFFNLYGTLLSFVLGQTLVFFITLICVLKNNWFKKEMFLSKIDKKYLKKLSNYTLMTLTSAIIGPVSLIIIRNHIITTIGWNEAGYWDAIWKISGVYLMLITTSLSVYYLPKLSEIKHYDLLKKEIFNGYKIIMPIVIILAISIYVFRDLEIKILFSKTFLPMKHLFFYQLIGDVLKVASWLLSYVMIAKTMTKIFILTEILFSLGFVVLSFVFMNLYGLIGVTIAFAVNYFFYLIGMIIIFKKLLIGVKS